MYIKRKLTYMSERGREFDTPKEAIDYDDEIPRIMRTYEGNLRKYMAIENPSVDDKNTICSIQYMIKDLKGKWERAQQSKRIYNMSRNF
jgi:hypothetical protein